MAYIFTAYVWNSAALILTQPNKSNEKNQEGFKRNDKNKQLHNM